MQQPTPTPMPGRLIAGLPARISHRWQQALNRLHAAGDGRAREQGWTITTSPGAFGLGVRAYRDPRFAARQLAAPTTPAALEAGRSR